MGDQDIQGQYGQTYSMTVRYMFADQRVQLTQSWKEEGFGSQTVIGIFVTYQLFNTYYPNEVLITPFLVRQKSSQMFRGEQEIDMKWQNKYSEA